MNDRKRISSGLAAMRAAAWAAVATVALAGTPVASAQTGDPLDPREAAAAAAEAQRGHLDDRGQDYRANALQRCVALPSVDLRRDCESRVRGEGTHSGSVQSGGILRETTTTVVQPPATAPAEPGSQGASGAVVRDLAPSASPLPAAPAPQADPPAPAVRGRPSN